VNLKKKIWSFCHQATGVLFPIQCVCLAFGESCPKPAKRYLTEYCFLSVCDGSLCTVYRDEPYLLLQLKCGNSRALIHCMIGSFRRFSDPPRYFLCKVKVCVSIEKGEGGRFRVGLALRMQWSFKVQRWIKYKDRVWIAIHNYVQKLNEFEKKATHEKVNSSRNPTEEVHCMVNNQHKLTHIHSYFASSYMTLQLKKWM
jgi:hypothetical protein